MTTTPATALASPGALAVRGPRRPHPYRRSPHQPWRPGDPKNIIDPSYLAWTATRLVSANAHRHGAHLARHPRLLREFDLPGGRRLLHVAGNHQGLWQVTLSPEPGGTWHLDAVEPLRAQPHSGLSVPASSVGNHKKGA